MKFKSSKKDINHINQKAHYIVLFIGVKIKETITIKLDYQMIKVTHMGLIASNKLSHIITRSVTSIES